MNFVTFPLSFLSEVGIRSCRFLVAAGPGMRVRFFMCDPVQSRSQSANLQKLQSCQVNERKQKSCKISCIWKLA